MVNYFIKNENSNSNDNNSSEMDLVTCIIIIILVISLIYYLMNFFGYNSNIPSSYSWYIIIALIVSAVYLYSCE